MDVPPGTTELGIDIIKVARIRASIERFGDRFSKRVLTEAERRAESVLSSAHAEAERELAAAAEQTAWTRSTVDSLLGAAQQEATLIRLAGHGEAARQVARTRRRLQDVIGRVRERLAEDIAEADRRAVELSDAAEHVRASAEEEAQRLRADAETDADLVRRDADAYAAQVNARAERRLEEAEAGARILRGRVAEEVVRSQRSAQDELRRGREEAAALVAEARREADELRTQARRSLEEARTEVGVLSRRRDEIAEELAQLSGVIQALAVPADALPTSASSGRTHPSSHAPLHQQKEDDQR
jgi:hypothetical protein